jgi:membrane protein required for colicin V production
MNAGIQTYDIVMLVVLAAALGLGAWKGMVWQLASLGSLLLSAWMAIHFSAPLAKYFSAEEPWNRFLAMLVLYAATSLAIWLLFRMVSGIINKVKLREFDRQMGAMFGLFKGALLCIVITFFAVTLSEPARQLVLKSYSGDAIARLTRNAGPILPEDVRSVLGKYIDELDKKLDPNTPAAQPEYTNAGTDNWPNPRSDLERKIQEASQKLEDLSRNKLNELGRKADQQLDDLGRQSRQALDQ